MEGGGAYGAGKAGGPFDPLTFIRKPSVILRAVSWVSVDSTENVASHQFTRKFFG